MATRYGSEVLQWLEARGWTAAPLDRTDLPGGDVGAMRFGDRRVIDPVTGDDRDVYSAAKMHRERTGDYPDVLKQQES